MKVAFSNIAWTPHDSPDVLALLRKQSVAGIEVAPTKIWPDWIGATSAAARQYRTWMSDNGFEIPALQAILFGRPDLHLFDPSSEVALVEHLAHVAVLGEALGARVAVLGAPKQRTRGSLSFEEALERCVPLFRRLGRLFDEHGGCLCIEPNPRRYGCDFIVNAREGVKLVQAVDHPGFALHLDAAGMHLEGDVLAELWPEVHPMLRHFHISEPDLGGFSNPVVPHAANLAFLREHGYDNWCSDRKSVV